MREDWKEGESVYVIGWGSGRFVRRCKGCDKGTSIIRFVHGNFRIADWRIK